ncbi:hypothetical protein KFL_009390030 [Klebsormidium nitens]|uniref:Uncharacterized protein n=1 Tax=Klebsormidium nitens TaxID=105231 RepID=A0A1Y1IU28_KLENI|nr:hypothetical protein KFL_009390030 [Klebsormidium nitens]|eukprot:GAQ92177.1 hypothetical protein KFL_009390030 [Klebsormidium nitens]
MEETGPPGGCRWRGLVKRESFQGAPFRWKARLCINEAAEPGVVRAIVEELFLCRWLAVLQRREPFALPCASACVENRVDAVQSGGASDAESSADTLCDSGLMPIGVAADRFRELGYPVLSVEIMWDRESDEKKVNLPGAWQTSTLTKPSKDPKVESPLLPESAPEESESLDSIFEDVCNHILPGVTHWQSPN